MFICIYLISPKTPTKSEVSDSTFTSDSSDMEESGESVEEE